MDTPEVSAVGLATPQENVLPVKQTFAAHLTETPEEEYSSGLCRGKSTVPVGKSVRRATLDDVCSNLNGKICLTKAHFNFKYNYFSCSHSRLLSMHSPVKRHYVIQDLQTCAISQCTILASWVVHTP